MFTPREKSPVRENFPRGGSNLRRCGQRAQTLPVSYFGPRITPFNVISTIVIIIIVIIIIIFIIVVIIIIIIIVIIIIIMMMMFVILLGEN